jgi:hypothetical protein
MSIVLLIPLVIITYASIGFLVATAGYYFFPQHMGKASGSEFFNSLCIWPLILIMMTITSIINILDKYVHFIQGNSK